MLRICTVFRNIPTVLKTGTYRNFQRAVNDKLLKNNRSVIKFGVFQYLQRFHQSAFSDKYLLLTNIAISIGLSTLGDVLEQQYEILTGEIENYSEIRTTRMAISGGTVGLVCHFWYQLLDKYMPGRSIRIVIKKILLDQIICSPLYISVFFITLGILESKTKEELWEEMKDKAVHLYAADWIVWPTAQFINFYYLPLRYRVFYDNFISLGYDVYTSHVKHKKPA